MIRQEVAWSTWADYVAQLSEKDCENPPFSHQSDEAEELKRNIPPEREKAPLTDPLCRDIAKENRTSPKKEGPRH